MKNFYLSIFCGLAIGLLISIIIIQIVDMRDNKKARKKIDYIYDVLSDPNSTSLTK